MYRVLDLWKADLKQINEKAAEALADPAKYPNLFPDLEWALKVESVFLTGRNNFVSSVSYLEAKKDLDLNLIELFKAQATIREQPVVTVAEDKEEPNVEEEVQEEELPNEVDQSVVHEQQDDSLIEETEEEEVIPAKVEEVVPPKVEEEEEEVQLSDLEEDTEPVEEEEIEPVEEEEDDFDRVLAEENELLGTSKQQPEVLEEEEDLELVHNSPPVEAEKDILEQDDDEENFEEDGEDW